MNQALIDSLIVKATEVGLNLLKGVAIWVIGRWLIKFAVDMMAKQMEHRKIDATIVGYARSTVGASMNIVLAVVLLGVFGIETTSFAAFVAGAGLAIGAAWGGLLSNLAAGAFLIVLRPFKTGDTISAGGVTGTVVEIGLFVTTFLTPDNVITYVGNSKILSSTVKNYSASDSRRVELVGNLKRSKDLEKTMAQVRERLFQVPNVLAIPAPEVNVSAFDEHCCTLAIRPYTHSDNFFQVQFDATNAMRDLLDGAGAHGHGWHPEGEEGEAAEGEEAEEAEEEEEE